MKPPTDPPKSDVVIEQTEDKENKELETTTPATQTPEQAKINIRAANIASYSKETDQKVEDKKGKIESGAKAAGKTVAEYLKDKEPKSTPKPKTTPCRC